jgi:hypothetical protein
VRISIAAHAPDGREFIWIDLIIIDDRIVDMKAHDFADHKRAAMWFESQRPGLGTEFVLELDAVTERARTPRSIRKHL